MIFVEKYVKQVNIEAETMLSMARTMILPAAMAHQKRIADAVQGTQGAGVDCEDQRQMLEDFVGLVNTLRTAIEELAHALEHSGAGGGHGGGGAEDPMDHAKHIKAKVKPAMSDLREAADQIEMHVADDLWPMPKYRDLLFIK